MKKITSTLLKTLVFLLATPVARAQQVADTILLEDKSKVVCRTAVDVKPIPEFQMFRFIAKTIRYPDDAREEGIQGKVYVSFTVTDAGKVTNPSIVSSPHEVLSKEVLRLIGLMPEWTPTTTAGKPVNVTLEMPVSFKLE
ncbi:MAG: energy transducer TonB [Chitinophagaceae bacterium]|nr:energy transducer TonB [Chitinophagaceae bacterium]